MHPKIYFIEIIQALSGDYLFKSADSALLKKLGLLQEGTSLKVLTLEQLGLNSTIISALISVVSVDEQIPVRKLALINNRKQKVVFSAFCSVSTLGKPTEKTNLPVKLYLVDTNSFAQVETELRKSEEKYRELLDNANSIILRWDKHGIITYFNEFAQRFFGYSEKEIIGQHVMDTIVPRIESSGRDLSSLMDDICEHPENYESNINENCTKDGRRVWINWTNKVLSNDKGEVIGALSIGSDITRKKQMEEELRHKHKMDAIGQLAGGMAHDFNNMLHGIMGFAEILETRLEDKKLRLFAGRIINIARQSSELTGQLLAFARKGQYQLVSIDIHHEISELITMLEHMLDKKIEINMLLDAENPCIEGDPTQIKSSLLNLSLNAKDAMPNGGTLSFKTSNIVVTKELIDNERINIRPGHYLKLDVIDTGTGISEKNKDHIFEPFFTTKSRGKGTGMGLAAVYGTLVNHGGDIVLNQSIGKGCCFSLYFLSSKRNSQHKTGEIKQKQYLPDGKAHILLVDDEALIRAYTKELFGQHGHKIETCANGIEAIKIYNQSKESVDLVILDMIMPKMGGRETFSKLKHINPDVKVVVASGYGIDEEVQAMLDDGVIDFIQKPFTMESLAGILQKITS